ncbi:hypothetical protein D8T57_19770, partial [Vibrio vulnificus]|uniref:hypothetical protein n=1 Tax=Vibrio vulnificus TaxID=672 RepID=UPI00102AC383
TIKDSITSLLMRPTSVGKDTQHELGQPLKKLAYVSNHRGPLLMPSFGFDTNTITPTNNGIENHNYHY